MSISNDNLVWLLRSQTRRKNILSEFEKMLEIAADRIEKLEQDKEKEMTKFDLAEASQRMDKAIDEMTKVAILLQSDQKYFDDTIKEIKEQIGDMTVAVDLINSYLWGFYGINGRARKSLCRFVEFRI